MTRLRPLHLWKVTHLLPEGENHKELTHYLVLPSRDIRFVWRTLGVATWEVKGREPSTIEWIEQISNLVCYSQDENSSPVEVRRLQYYNPAASRYANFDRDVEAATGNDHIGWEIQTEP